MPSILKISDVDAGGVLAFDLRHLLSLVIDLAPDLLWRVLPAAETTWLLGKTSAVIPVQQFSIRVDDSESGVNLTWREIQELAESIHQTVWGTFIAIRSEAVLPALTDLFLDDWRYVDRAAPALYDRVEIAFQAVDSSYWLVFVKNAEVRERMRTAFEEVEVIEVREQ